MKTHVLLFFLLITGFVCFSGEIPERPKPTVMVNDFVQLLTPEEQQKLEHLLNSYRDSTSTEIVLVIQETIDNEDIKAHAELIAKKWGIGGEKNENGVIIAYAVKENHIGVVPGYGLKNFVDDHSAYRVRENLLKPKFRKGDYFGGFEDASLAIMKLISGHYEVHDVKSNSNNATISIIVILSVFFIFFIILPAWRYRSIKKSHMGGHMDIMSIFLLMNNLGGTGRSFGDFKKGKGNFNHQLSVSSGGGGSSGTW